jgi:hypothetical protein
MNAGFLAGVAAAVLALGVGSAKAAEAAKGSDAHIRAVTAKVDGAKIRANAATPLDRPTYGLDYAGTRYFIPSAMGPSCFLNPAKHARCTSPIARSWSR